MDLRLLEYFLAVARAGNITKAAEQLHVTQPTISRQLMDLEEVMGTPLLCRGKRQVTLTDAGVLFQQRAEEIVTLMEKTQQDLADQNDLVGGTVAVGCVESSASRMLPEVLKNFAAQHPRVQYQLYSADGDDIREKLDRGELDFGILLEPIEAAKYDYLRLPYWETWGLLMRSDDPLAEKAAMTVEDILPLPLILPRREIVQDNIAGWFGVERSQLHIFAGHNLINNGALLVEAGLGYAFCVGGCFAIRQTEGLKFVPLTPERTTGHVLAWKKNRVFHPAAHHFREFIEQEKACVDPQIQSNLS
ncbi:LysR family transcriptional regulator [Oscillibacter sp. MSJ-2]|uniref:LysR family transcriptional regulator n=1 Tax=Dysosmobacter acutus TaxID=2841504 RepID=A0ABS6F7T9_9FIRM|nr:LysR family transcriptional regulator [Dysosmobacter acutus]MBU5626113.1 LysR family transcriptional regulator [Dysosmobacter acutus]